MYDETKHKLELVFNMFITFRYNSLGTVCPLIIQPVQNSRYES